MPEVSIVIPAYNCEAEIANALASVARQTFDSFEVIVVNDGSSDRTAERVSASGIPNLKLYQHDNNRGAAAARNTGIRAANSTFIAFLDADDTWEPNKLELQVAEARSAASRLHTNCTNYYLHSHGRASTVLMSFEPQNFKDEILWGCSISPGTTLLTARSTFDTVGFFDEEFRRLEDWDWLLRLANFCGVSVIQTPLAHIHFSDRSAPPEIDARYDPVFLGAERILSKHLPQVSARSRIGALKFLSSVQVERAARWYHRKQTWRAIAAVGAALSYFPIRNAAFFRSVWRAFRNSRV